MTDLQKRKFLLLMDDDEHHNLAKEVLESPLGLSSEILKCIFENRIEELKNKLDDIKGFTAGIKSARDKSAGYKIASYYDYMFSFHQFVHSSFRARQGSVLENILDIILERHCKCDLIPPKKKKKHTKIKEIYAIKDNDKDNEYKKLDIDSLGINTKERKAVVIQLRSRDDTGGSTAKGSLVDYAKVLLKLKNDPSYEICYLICVWEPLNSQQKNITIEKIYLSLRDVIEIEREKLYNQITSGIELKKNFKLHLVYGTEELSDTLKEWADITVDIEEVINGVISRIEDWDDLWVAYGIANLEIEKYYLTGKSNFEYLKEKLKELDTRFDFSNYENLKRSIDRLTIELFSIWRGENLPVTSPADQTLYIRDMLYLLACYKKIINPSHPGSTQTKLF